MKVLLCTFLKKDVLKIWSKFTGEHPCRSAISNKVAKHLFSEHLFLRTPLDGCFWVFHKSSCLTKWCDEILLFCTSRQKQESFTCKFTKNCTSSQAFFQEFNHTFRIVILKNTSLWLLLRTIIFWKQSSMAAFQRQQQR